MSPRGVFRPPYRVLLHKEPDSFGIFDVTEEDGHVVVRYESSHPGEPGDGGIKKVDTFLTVKEADQFLSDMLKSYQGAGYSVQFMAGRGH